MIASPLLALPQESEYFQGKTDGERDAEATDVGFGWLLLGCVGGVLWAYILEPDVPSAQTLVGKSSEYVAGYNEGYKAKIRSKRVKQAFIGCVVSGVAYCALYFLVFAAAASEDTTY